MYALIFSILTLMLAPPAVLNFTMNNLDGKPVNLAKYEGNVILIVNVASQCGYTPQYTDLETIYETYKDKGFEILAFPANNFGQQEPGTNAEIADFCKKNFGVDFDMFSKISVLGNAKAPLYKYLTSPQTNPKFAGEVDWNFEKFLIGRNGQVLARFKSPVEPLSKEMISAVEAALAAR